MLCCNFIFFHFFTYISTKSIIEQLQSAWKSYLSVNIVNNDQGLIQIKWIEKVQHIKSAQRYTHDRPLHWRTDRYTLVLPDRIIYIYIYIYILYIYIFHTHIYSCISYSYTQNRFLEMYYIHHINFFSIHANVCAQKSLKRTSPGFDSVAPLPIMAGVLVHPIDLKLRTKVHTNKNF